MPQPKIVSVKNAEAFNLTLACLKKGGIVIFPTDTVYGIGGSAMNLTAVKKVLAAKKRQPKKPLPLLVASLSMAKKYAIIDQLQTRFLKTHWPGPVTAILESKIKMPAPLVVNRKIGLRVPNHLWLIKLIKKLGQPLIGTSANLAGRPATGKINEVMKFFNRTKIRPDLIISAGNLPQRRPSTVIDLTSNQPKILR